jgi:hypothetical protein
VMRRRAILNSELPASFSPLSGAFCFLEAANPDGPPFLSAGAEAFLLASDS